MATSLTLGTSAIGVAVPTLAIVDGVPTTTSTDVARHFGKQHRNVLQAVELLVAQLPPEAMLNFQQGYYTLPETGDQQHKQFILTRDGFTLLAMGFTGKRALAFKLAYIDAFNRMEAALSKPAPTPAPKIIDVDTLCSFIAGGVIDSDAVLRIGSAAGMMMYRNANVTEKGWGDAVAAQIDETLSAHDLNVILQAAALETWHHARGASKPPAKTVPLRADFQLAK